MTTLEKSVQDLKVALEELSVRVERKTLAHADQQETLATVRDQAGAAQKYAGKAALDLAGVIDQLRAMTGAAESAPHDGEGDADERDDREGDDD